jgi:uncharacterized protein YcfL
MKINLLVTGLALLLLSGCQVANESTVEATPIQVLKAVPNTDSLALQDKISAREVKGTSTKAKNKSPDDKELHYVVGTFYKNSGTNTKTPTDKELHYVIGTFYMEAGQNDKATESLVKALTPPLGFTQALSEYGLKFDVQSTNSTKSSVALNYQDPSFDKMIYLSQDYFKQAISQLELFKQTYPNNEQVQKLLNNFRRALKNTEKAVEYKKRLDA